MSVSIENLRTFIEFKLLDAKGELSGARMARDLQEFTGFPKSAHRRVPPLGEWLANFSGHPSNPAAVPLVGQKKTQIANIVAGRSGDDRVAQPIEERKGIEGGERLLNAILLPKLVGRGALIGLTGASQCAAIDYGSGSGTVAVDAVGTGAQHGDALSCDVLCAGQGELLVASTDASVADGDGYFASGYQAYARHLAAQLFEPA